MSTRSEAELRDLLEQAMRDEHDLVAKQIRFHVVQVFASRHADTAVGEARHRHEILQLLDQYARERSDDQP
jgi:hypothetical protein